MRPNFLAVNHSQPMLKAGDTVPRSGIYRFHHVGEHMAPGDVLLFQGVELPRCAQCAVTFRLRKVVPHISEDADFQS